MYTRIAQNSQDTLSSFPGLRLGCEDGRVFEIDSIRYLALPSVKVIASFSSFTNPKLTVTASSRPSTYPYPRHSLLSFQ